MSQVFSQQRQDVYIPLCPLTYTGLPPAPDAPCTDPTPDEQYKIAIQEQQLQFAAREQQQQQHETTTEPTAGQGGTAQQLVNEASNMIQSLKSMVSHVALNVERGATDVTSRTAMHVRELDHRHNVDRFRRCFPQLAAEGEILLGDFTCDAMHNGSPVRGHLHITRRYLCFSSENASPMAAAASVLLEAVGKNNTSDKIAGVREAIPFLLVVTIQRSLALPMVTPTGGYYFLPLPHEKVVASALQVYVEDGKRVLQFLNFDSFAAATGSVVSPADAIVGTSLDRAYNYLDHAWRSCTTVPVEGVTYAEGVSIPGASC